MQIMHLNFAKGFRGGEKQTQLLIEELSKFGFKQKLLVRKGSELTQRCEKIPNLNIIEISKPYIFHFKHLKDVTLLHAHETKALQYAFFAKKLFAIPYIVTRRVDNPIKSNFLNFLMYRDANVCVALTNAIKTEILKVSANAKIEIIPDAYSNVRVNKDIVQTIKKEYGNSFIIGHVGALDDKHKGQSVSIELAKIMQRSHPDIHFVFVGGGDDEQMFKQMATGLQNITFTGFVNNVNDYIATFDIFLFPSRNEGLGSTLLDVMNVGVPIVASSVGGIPEIITNKVNGILFDISDIQNLKLIILNLYNNKEKREELARNAKKGLNKYSPQTIADSYIQIYQALS